MKNLTAKDGIIAILLGYVIVSGVFRAPKNVGAIYTEKEYQMQRKIDSLVIERRFLEEKDRELQIKNLQYEQIILKNTDLVINGDPNYRDSLRSAVNPK